MHEQLPYYYDWFPWWKDALEWGHNALMQVAEDYYVDDIKEKFGQLRLSIRTPAWANLEEGKYEDVAWEIQGIVGHTEIMAKPI